jgi:hypothetical protein
MMNDVQDSITGIINLYRALGGHFVRLARGANSERLVEWKLPSLLEKRV